MSAMSGSNPLRSILRLEQENFWDDHRHCTADETQRLWNQRRAEIMGWLAPDPPPPPPRPDAPTLPAAPTAPPMARTVSDRPAHRRQSTTSYPRPPSSNLPMARNITLGTSTARKRPAPFNGSTAAPAMNGLERSSFDKRLRTAEDGPWSGFQPSKQRRVAPVQGAPAPVEITYTPEQFAVRMGGEQGIGGCSFTTRTQIPQGALDGTGCSSSSTIRPAAAGGSPLSLSPSVQSCAGLTNGSTQPTEMSRDISANSEFCRQLNDVRLTNSPNPLDVDPYSPLPAHSPAAWYSPRDSKHTVGSGSQFDQCLDMTSGTPASLALPVTISLDEDVKSEAMVLDAMVEPTVPQLRSSLELSGSGVRPLRPKNEEAASVKKATGSPADSPKTETPVVGANAKMALTPLKTVQPEVPKLMCNQCDKHPSGFRGPHELTRHQVRDHGSTRTVWVCIDQSPERTLLANCKHCKSNKQYGAYYNAAAHIRRHFQRARGMRAGAGSSGGNWPPMDQLKSWMQEVQVTRPPVAAAATQPSPPPIQLVDDALVSPAPVDDAERQPTEGTEPPFDPFQQYDLYDTFFQDLDNLEEVRSQDLASA